MKAQIAVYTTHENAIKALKTLNSNDFPMDIVSLVGKAEILDDHIHVKSLDNVKNTPAYVGMGAGTLIGILSGIGIFTIPGFGFLYGAGALVGAIAGLDLGIVTGGLATVFTRMGVTEDQSVKCEEHLKQGSFMLVINGNEEEVNQAEKILHTEKTHVALMN